MFYIYHYQLGVCQCNENYAGYDCSVDKNHIPTLQPFYFDGLCDRFSRPCQETGVYADLLLDSDNLKCQVQVKDVRFLLLDSLAIIDNVCDYLLFSLCLRCVLNEKYCILLMDLKNFNGSHIKNV